MKKCSLRLLAGLMALSVCGESYGDRYTYETVAGDPMKTKVYTLPNGLKVYMSVNKDMPRIQTNIAVKVGSKNDPAETTGLAHYFEHMMFKGTTDFGTTDYAAEKPLLDKIEELFEIYRQTTDTTARANIYHQIDSISYEASKIAIPNEYDKLMTTIGAIGTNAYTSYDKTCYVEDIPSNELERWAKIQSNRFEKPVLRGFHTELETIYEEKNMSLTRDGEKMVEGLLGAMFPNHPYGQWSVLGHQQHLKNPSITNIKEYHKNWYVPNNMAILLSGDFDPDTAVDIITKYFGQLKANEQLPKLTFTPESPITSPVETDVWGNEAEALMLAWRLPKASHEDIEKMELLEYIINNGQAGLIDLDINQKQKALSAGAMCETLSDYSIFLVSGRPKEGQTLEELKRLLLEEFAKLRNGDFDNRLIAATINNFKASEQKELDSNNGRVDRMETSFINDIPMSAIVSRNERLSKMTKEDIVAMANKYLREDNYIAIYKRQGQDTTELKIAKQPITPIEMNRDTASAYLNAIVAEKVQPIKPVFVDFEKDLTFLNANKNIPVIYKQNLSNDMFTVTYVYDYGVNDDKEISMLNYYMELLGTKKMDNEEYAQKFYELACSYQISVGKRESHVTLEGLSENMKEAMALLDELMNNAVADKEMYDNVVEQTIKSRENRLKNQSANFNALYEYISTGPEQMKSYKLTNEELKNISPQHLTDQLKSLNKMEHTIIYYGPMDEKTAIATIEKTHKTPKKLTKIAKKDAEKPLEPKETTYFIAPYDAKQLYMSEYSCVGKLYDPAIENQRMMFNEYFGGGMNSIVFQEMRERRSLAYSAGAYFQGQRYLDEPYRFRTTIATQNDKMADAIEAFSEIIEEMPLSQNAFELAKQGMEARLRTERFIKDNAAWVYINSKRLGLKSDWHKTMYEALPSMTLETVSDFHQKHVKGHTYHVGILGDPKDLDLEYLRSRGKVVMLTTEEIFNF